MATFGYEDSETPATPVITVEPATVEAFSTEVGTPVTATVTDTGKTTLSLLVYTDMHLALRKQWCCW